MDELADRPARSAAPWKGALAVLGLAALCAWQVWLALGLFGTDDPWRTLLDDQPILSGSHPQHLYLGSLGAQALARDGCICVYDAAFAAGYPKTPIFNGSRIAELTLLAGGGEYNPAAYKMGLLAICLLVPILLYMACLGAGLSIAASFLATAVGIVLAWGPSGRSALEAADGNLLLASLFMLAHLAMLVRFHQAPGFFSWLGLWLTGSLIWFAQPLVFAIALPLVLFFYLCVGAQHGSVTWHAMLFLAQAAAVAVNFPWLVDWLSYWWLRAPLPAASAMLPHRTLQTFWEAPLWGGAGDRALALFIAVSGLIGIVALHYQQRQAGAGACRVSARLLLLGSTCLLVLAFLGISWEPIGQMGTSVFFLPGLWFAALPAAHAWVWLSSRLVALGAWGGVLATCLLAGAGYAALQSYDDLLPLALRCRHTEPLQIGLGPAREAIVKTVAEQTGPEARILWEDRPLPRQAPRWSALLPILTNRSYIGGLDPDGFIEHSSISFIDGALEGRPIAAWTDDALSEYCKRYNVGWAALWSPAAIKRFGEWSGAIAVTSLHDDVPGQLFLIKHAPRSYALKGKAKLVHADWHHITLADVVPTQDGVVVLSLHYQAGMKASPSRVEIEREPQGHDPIGFVRLRVANPVACVTLTWGER